MLLIIRYLSYFVRQWDIKPHLDILGIVLDGFGGDLLRVVFFPHGVLGGVYGVGCIITDTDMDHRTGTDRMENCSGKHIGIDLIPPLPGITKN